jgi:hypothetical protein
MERDRQDNLMECDEHAWIVTNFLADEGLWYAHRLLSHGKNQVGDDKVEMVKRRRILRIEPRARVHWATTSVHKCHVRASLAFYSQENWFSSLLLWWQGCSGLDVASRKRD